MVDWIMRLQMEIFTKISQLDSFLKCAAQYRVGLLYTATLLISKSSSIVPSAKGVHQVLLSSSFSAPGHLPVQV
jgi:hypothetical protein